MIDTRFRFYYWGPFLTKFKLPKQTVKELLQHSKKSKDYGHTLAGIIKNQYEYDAEFFFNKIKVYIDSYISGASKNWDWNKHPKSFGISNAWINYMKAGEFNPPHVHSADLSCVAFLKIPKGLKKENKNFKGCSGGPGTLEFRYGEAAGFSFRTSENFLPEEGDFFIFPAKLQHYVCPFYSKGERVSMSANFELVY